MAHLLDGNGCVITGPFYVKGAQNDAGIEAWPYDPVRAAELLDEAGWVDSDGDGVRDRDGRAFRFKFMYSGSYVLYERLARLLKDEAAKVGIEVVPEPYEWSVVLERLNERDFDSVVMNWAGGIVEDPYRMWHCSQIGGGGANYVGFNNQKADIIIEEIRKSFDEAERKGLFHELGRIIHEEQPCSFLFTRPSFRLVDRRFENVIIHDLGLNYSEWYVPREQQRYK